MPLLGPLAALPAPLVQECVRLCDHLRTRQPDTYRRLALTVEEVVSEELRAGRPEELGSRATFRKEADRLLEGALQALDDDRWEDVQQWAAERLRGGFWATVEPARGDAWRLLARLAELGHSLQAAGPELGEVRDLVDAVDRYTGVGDRAGAWVVDQAHRALERELCRLLPTLTELPLSAPLRAQVEAMRQSWRVWADNWSTDFAGVCGRRGYLPPAEFQQRTLFDQVVKPWANEGQPVVYFLVDALRYEMAEALRRALEGESATNVRLAGRLAELPTETAVGMNALAPVARSGRLTPVLDARRIQGFRAAEFTVRRPQERQRAMAERVGGRTCPWLELREVLTRDKSSLTRAVQGASLVVVHSIEIDEAGEHGTGPLAFDGVLQQLEAAWRRLREAGLRRFVFTADHGFLLLDPDTPTRRFGRRVDPCRRHVLRDEALTERGLQHVALADLGYDDVGDRVLHFPTTVHPFDTGRRERSFAHGGNSLQERVIPVLTVEHRGAPGRGTLSYRVRAVAGESLGDLCCLEGTLELGEAPSLVFSGSSELLLHLEVVAGAEVRVDLVQVRRGGRRDGDGFQARVGEPFEVFFRLFGRSLAPVALQVVHRAGQAEVTTARVDGTFRVRPLLGLRREEPVAESPGTGLDLSVLPEAVRPVFAQLAQGRVVTEADLQTLLGRRARRFARRVEEHAQAVGIRIRVEITAGGTKRYVPEEP